MEDFYLKILDYLKQERNFDYAAYHIELLKRRIENRIVRIGAGSPENYYSILKTKFFEPDLLIENFMINVSYFFRNALCFELVNKNIIPELIRKKQNSKDRTIRIWSAGCANGEEAYSLAILFADQLKKEKSTLNTRIFATDFDSSAIGKAKQAIFSSESIKNVKHHQLQNYFTEKDGKYFLNSEIKEMVQFSIYDLLDKNSHAPRESIFGDFDLIVCRNVLIYFNPDFQEIIFSKLYKSLSHNGILMLGEAEVPLNSFRAKFEMSTKYCKIFKKVSLS
ncbi:MAG TPA: chemotaxis protein CheR [Bacteroidales bacterium]|nr:chemotaxis protein CheR [Bacteroidales bacterium]